MGKIKLLWERFGSYFEQNRTSYSYLFYAQTLIVIVRKIPHPSHDPFMIAFTNSLPFVFIVASIVTHHFIKIERPRIWALNLNEPCPRENKPAILFWFLTIINILDWLIETMFRLLFRAYIIILEMFILIMVIGSWLEVKD